MQKKIGQKQSKLIVGAENEHQNFAAYIVCDHVLDFNSIKFFSTRLFQSCSNKILTFKKSFQSSTCSILLKAELAWIYSVSKKLN
jgi:hypothetical protein